MTAPHAPIDWQVAPAELRIAPGEVHVWRVPLAPSADEVAALGRTLAPDERTRAGKFYFERDRRSFTVARGALRSLLGRYLQQPADQLEFGYLDKGKPYLARPAGDSLRFNLSHSGDFALIAFTRGRELGVDVELRRAMSDLVSLANTSFSRSEFAVFRALPSELHVEAFFTCWSRKEAFIKATGEGVSQLEEFDVSLRPGEPARVLAVRGASAAQAWTMYELPTVPGHAAALVLAGSAPVELMCWRWPGS